jgi:hypothetical protein
MRNSLNNRPSIEGDSGDQVQNGKKKKRKRAECKASKGT